MSDQDGPSDEDEWVDGEVGEPTDEDEPGHEESGEPTDDGSADVADLIETSGAAGASTARPDDETWREVLGDMAATAAEFDDAGWETVECHPGDVTVLVEDGEAVLDVVLPDDEYETAAALLETGVAFDEYEVLKAADEALVYLVVVMKDTDGRVALLYPAYYDREAAASEDVFETARSAGRLNTHLRRLQGDFVHLRHDDPHLFEPDE